MSKSQAQPGPPPRSVNVYSPLHRYHLALTEVVAAGIACGHDVRRIVGDTAWAAEAETGTSASCGPIAALWRAMGEEARP